MNRFAAAGLFVEAAKGARILVVTTLPTDALKCFLRVEEIEAWPGVEVRRTNGAELIDLGGRGRIEFRSIRSGLRGMSADVVFIDDEADRRLSDRHRDDFYRDAGAIIAASPNGEIVRA